MPDLRRDELLRLLARTGTRRSTTTRPATRSCRPSSAGEDWAWCFVDRLTLDLGDDGDWRTIDPFFDAGLEFAREAIAGGQAVPFPPGATASDGFPLGVWESTYRGRHRAGTLDPDQAAELEALPGWHW